LRFGHDYLTLLDRLLLERVSILQLTESALAHSLLYIAHKDSKQTAAPEYE
jgi:hypothetical protein